MADSADTLFIEMAVAKAYLDRGQADEALTIQRATAGDGEGRRLLRGIVVEEGWMTEAQVAEVEAQIEDGTSQTGKIEGYKLLAKIAQGGMGTVYKAEREATGEMVALKILPKRMAEKGDFVERFLRESRAASRIQSEHIVRTVDVGFSGGYYYFAMEYVEGESVDTTISIDGPMDEAKALRIIRQMAIALRDAAVAAMVHRDIKPGNILVREDGVAKLTDFGLARDITDDSITQTGVTLGTPNYMSPEQAKAMKSLDARSDIYSLGVTFYHMVTGAVPFKGDTSLLTMLKHLNEQPVAPMTRRPELSGGCNDVILKMLAKDRDKRYRSPDQLLADLDLVIAGKPAQYAESTERKPEELPPGAKVSAEMTGFGEEIRRRARLRRLRLGAVAFLIILVGLMAGLFFTADEPETNARTGNVKADKPSRREEIARTELEAAKAFARKNPVQLAAIEERFATVERKHRSTPVHEEARRLHLVARRNLGAAVNRALAAGAKRADELLKQQRFAEAPAAYDAFPVELKTRRALERIDQAKRRLRRRVKTERQEAEAQSLFAGARKLAGSPAANTEQIAQTLWKLLESYTHTHYYAEHRQEIEALLERVATEEITVDTLFAVSPAQQPDGLSEFTYDFSDPAQAGDWPSVWAGRSLGRWVIDAKYKEMTAQSGLVYFKVPLSGDYRLELRAKDLRAASICFAVPDPSASAEAAGCSFKWKRAGGGAVTTVTKEGQALDPAKTFPRFRVVGGVTFVLEVKSRTITIWAGDHLAHRISPSAKAIDPNAPGYLVLDGFNPGARLTAATIRCKLDRERLQKTVVEPLEKAKLEEARWQRAGYAPLLEGSDAGAWHLSGLNVWTFARGYATAREGADGDMTAGEESWSDYAFCAKTLLGTAPGTARLLVRWSGESVRGDGYYVELAAARGARQGWVALRKATAGKSKILKQANMNVIGTEWYPICVEVRGPRIRVLLHDREVLHAEDDTYRAGRVGLASFQSGAQFTDIKIKIVR